MSNDEHFNTLYEDFLANQETSDTTWDSYGEVTARKMPEVRRRFLRSVQRTYATMYYLKQRTPELQHRTGGHYLTPDTYEPYVSNARLWFVAPDAVDLIAQASPTVPLDTTCGEDTLRLLVGNLPLLIGIGGEGIQSEEWNSRELWRVPLRLLFCYPALVGADMHIVTEWISTAKNQRGNEAWMPLSAQMVKIGDEIGEVDENVSDLARKSIIEDRQILVAILSFISQDHILSTKIEETTIPSRQVRRQAERKNKRLDLDQVRVSDLRPSVREDRTLLGTETSRYQHRWVVDGHWRSQPHGPGSSLRKPIWISPHLKGPDGAPLLTGDKVKVIRE